MQFGENLRRLREERGLSASDLRDRSGLLLSHIQYLEKDPTPPGPVTLARLAKGLAVSHDDLLSY